MINSNKEKQESWLSFQDKSSRSTKAHFTGTKLTKESIFKTPDTVEGKVGVVRSGMGMTNDYQRRKHTENHIDLQTPMDDTKYRESKRSKRYE